MDPQRTGVFMGQCAQYCGTQHAKMLLRVSVEGADDFGAWVHAQQKPAVEDAGVIAGRQVFERNACMNCHAVGGTPADGRFGPDLTHLMSRATIAAGAAENTHDNLRLWIQRNQTWVADASHEAERRGFGCRRELHGNAALERLES